MSHWCLREQVQSLHSQGQKERNLTFFSSGSWALPAASSLWFDWLGFFLARVCTHQFSSPTSSYLMSSLSEMIPNVSNLHRKYIMSPVHSWCQMSQEPNLRLKYFFFRLWHWNVDPSSQETCALSSCTCLTPAEISFYSSMSRNELCKQQ